MQMRTIKLSPTDFGYFFCNPQNDRTEKYVFFTENTKQLDNELEISIAW